MTAPRKLGKQTKAGKARNLVNLGSDFTLSESFAITTVATVLQVTRENSE
jgi:hypothetical protein